MRHLVAALHLLLLLHSARAATTDAESVAGSEEFSVFCAHNYWGPTGRLSNDGRQCEKEIQFVDTEMNARRFCQSQMYTGVIKDKTAAAFTCQFELLSACPFGYTFIQSQCYKVRTKMRYAERVAKCGEDGALPLESTTHTIGALLTRLTEASSIGSVWLNRRGSGRSTATASHSDDKYATSLSHAQFVTRSSRGTPKLVTDDDERHWVVCVQNVRPNYECLVKWCNINREELRMETFFDKDRNSCLYLTYNHHVVHMKSNTPAEIKKANQRLHEKCRLFFDDDHSPVDVAYLFKGDLSLVGPIHPVRVPGAAKDFTKFADATAWQMFTSAKTNAQANVPHHDSWRLASGPREARLSADGGASTLALLRVNGNVRFVDVAWFTPLPLLCEASLHNDVEAVGECNCPSTSVCAADGVSCECPAGYRDLQASYQYPSSAKPAPPGLLCFTCPETSLFVLIPLERNSPLSAIKRVVSDLFDWYGFANDRGQEIVLIPYSHYTHAPIYVTDGNQQDFRSKLDAIEAKGWAKYMHLEQIYDTTNPPNKNCKTHGGVYYTYEQWAHDAHFPHFGFKAALKELEAPRHRNRKKAVLYFTHRDVFKYNNGWLEKLVCNDYHEWWNLYFHTRQDLEESVKRMRDVHNDVQIFSIAVQGYHGGALPIGDSYENLDIPAKFYAAKSGGTRTTMEPADVRRTLDGFLCKPITRYADHDKFERRGAPAG